MAPSSLLLFLVSSSVWVALSSLPLITMAVPAADGQGEDCSPVLCGNVNISVPFGLVPDNGTKPIRCAAASIAFQISCKNNTPYFESYQSEYNLRIVTIFYHNRSLLVAGTHLQHPYFSSSSTGGCHIPTADVDDTFSQLALPFSASPVNQKLIFYNCTKPPPPPLGAGLVETVCHNNTFVGVADETRGESGGYLEGCKATTVPVLGVSGKVNASNYQQLVSDGYLATWQWPWPPPRQSGNFALGTSIIPNLSIYQLSTKRNNAFDRY